MAPRAAFQIGEELVQAGQRKTVDLPVSVLSDHTPVTMSVHVIHGRRNGPTVFVSSSVHGDEIIGVEIVRRLLRTRNLQTLRGTLMVVPIVNTFGFINHSRYLPDRRDLNRSFPGSNKGSLAARLANLFLTEVVERCELGFDLHSAAIHRTNLPQIRVSPKNPELLRLGRRFGAPVVLTSPIREGSLRAAAAEKGVNVLLYEAGEGLRFDEFAVRAGVAGILRVLNEMGMISTKGITKPKAASQICSSSRWIRAQAGGLLRSFRREGDIVKKNELLAAISDPFGEVELEIRSPSNGLIIGRTVLPIVNEGDAIFHLASVRSETTAEAALEDIAAHLEADPLFDEDEII
ncbi:succinylglutamate desuccinylase/aspartoacylase family protein [Hwanghaeella sp.]|uniref:succinylglutamate desuccinylase/aspartoacylase family protein n=1 Tax=Hwanghaeella sp. TaxID=2605943 RepID=UPI003CCBCCCC